MKFIKLFLILLVCLLDSPIHAGTLSGVTFSEKTEVGGKMLVLNGLGIRKKAFIKVYVAGLYLPQKETNSEKILRADSEWKMDLAMVRDIEKSKICKALNTGLKNNSPDKEAMLKDDFERLCGYLDDLKDKDHLTFTYIPNSGTSVIHNEKEKGVIGGKEFAEALLACWIGPKPPGEELKMGLMGMRHE